jgi:hypothetical protein
MIFVAPYPNFPRGVVCCHLYLTFTVLTNIPGLFPVSKSCPPLRVSPCVIMMYWPDNEPLPEQGQIRPSGLAGVPVSSQTHSFRLSTTNIFVSAAAYPEYRDRKPWAHR